MDPETGLTAAEFDTIRKEFDVDIAAAESEAGREKLTKQAEDISHESIDAIKTEIYTADDETKREELEEQAEGLEKGSVNAFRRDIHTKEGEVFEDWGKQSQRPKKRKTQHQSTPGEEATVPALKRINSPSLQDKATGSSSPRLIDSVSVQEKPSPSAEPESSMDQYSVSTLAIPIWYTEIKPDGLKMRALVKSKDTMKRQTIAALTSLKECVQRCETTTSPSILQKELNTLRDHVHKAEFLQPDELILRKVRMLDNGLQRIFTAPSIFPWDLRADALQLYRRWASRIFSIDLLRGINFTKAKAAKRNADSIDKAWRTPSPKFNGHGPLIVGQWWPTQLCTVRDGAHGAAQGGIYGEKECGAYSIVLSGGHGYSDEDFGDRILYNGTDSKDHHPTESTQRMIESADRVHLPVRVIRSWNPTKSNKFRPVRGFRYDGLYDVLGYRVLDPTKAIYNFELQRCAGQDPIRWEEGPAGRPTRWEVEEYDKLRDAERGVGRSEW